RLRREAPAGVRQVRPVALSRDDRGTMSSGPSPAYLVGGVRTPFGRYAGALARVRADDLARHVIRELLDRHPSVPAEAVSEVVLGCANQAGEDNRNVARMAALLAGLPQSVPGCTVNR